MKNFFIIFILLFTTTILKASFSGVIKESENRYIAKMDGQDVYFIAERLNNQNLLIWQNYGRTQDISFSREQGELKNSPSTGARFFVEALNYNNQMEQWVIYAAREYEILDTLDKISNVLIMYVSCNTRPESIITTHMGIAASIRKNKDGLYQDVPRPKNLSMDLHSFAAKVMLLRNSNRKFMVNIPAPGMAQIMLNTLPEGSIHYGTFEKFEELKSLEIQTFDQYLDVNTTKESIAKWRASRLKIFEQKKDSVASGHYESLQELQEDIEDYKYLHADSISGKLVVTLDESKLQEDLINIARRSYDSYRLAQLKLLEFGSSGTRKDVLEIFHNNPPIIHGGPKSLTLDFMDPRDTSRLLVRATQNDPVYGYLFLAPFRLFGPSLEYVAVDLDKLAAYGKLDAGFQIKH